MQCKEVKDGKKPQCALKAPEASPEGKPMEPVDCKVWLYDAFCSSKCCEDDIEYQLKASSELDREDCTILHAKCKEDRDLANQERLTHSPVSSLRFLVDTLAHG